MRARMVVTLAKKPIAVIGGKVTINGLENPDCPSWVKLQDLAGNTLTVGNDAGGCWKVGDDIAITSPDWDQGNAFESSITAIEDDRIILSGTPPSYFGLVTEAVYPEFAVEVIRLSRNIVFSAEQDDDTQDGLHGGHFIVFHTPYVVQKVEGVEFRYFGQQLNKGKYPVHVHMCGDMSGSEIRKNVVRDSYQRCYVIHGSDNVHYYDNVGWNAAGHCYFLEDGIEQGHVIERNIGGGIKIPQYVIPGESDGKVSVFWITNTLNSWIDNVAAGSEANGYWFETFAAVRGPSAVLDRAQGVRPVALSLTLFRGNVAHSSKTDGITYYSPGWRPTDGEQVIEDTKCYRNLISGMFVHANVNIAIVGGVLADNMKGIWYFQNENIRLENLDVIGYSSEYKAVLGATGSDYFCMSTPSSGQLAGIQIHPWRLGVEGPPGLVPQGLEAIDIRFSGFGNGCDGAAFEMNTQHVWKKTYDSIDKFRGVSFGDASVMADVCAAMALGVNTIAMHDQDGSFGSGSEGFVVSEEVSVTTFAGSCSSIGGCLSFCEGACLRQINIRTNNAYSTENIEMVIGDGSTEVTAGWSHYTYQEFYPEVNVDQNTLSTHDGWYGLALPEGDFQISFRDIESGKAAWPDYAEIVYAQAPECSGYATSVELTMPEFDSLRCSSFIKDGDIEAGFDSAGFFGPWQQQGLVLSFVSPGFGGTGSALTGTDRKSVV